MTQFIAIIPARYASTRFEGKPLVSIFGKPMIQHVYERVHKIFEYCIVATDDNRIEKAVKSFGGEVVMTSTEHHSGTDRCYEALQKAGILFNKQFDVVVNVQGDEPFIHAEQLKAIKECFDEPEIQIATLIKPFKENEDIFNANSPKVVISKEGFALYFSRSVIPYLRSYDSTRWQNNHTYYKHIGLYAYRSRVLAEITSLEQGELEQCESLEQLRWLENGYKIKTAITDYESHAIDTPADLEQVLKLYGNSFNK